MRSPFQVAVLLFLSCRLYIFWWSYYIRRSAATLLDERDAPGWRSICLLVPIVNLFLLHQLFERVKLVSLRSGLRTPMALAAWGIISVIALVYLGRLPLPYSSLRMLLFIPFAVAHLYFAGAEMLLTGGRALPTTFSLTEIFVIFLGLAIRAAFMFPYTFADGWRMFAQAWFAWAVLLAALVALAYFYRASRHIEQESFAGAGA